MKTHLFAFIFFLLSSGVIAQKNFTGFVNIGLPVRPEINWKGNNLTADFGLRKGINKNVLVGIGLSYLHLDLKPSNFLLTYDRELYNLFLEGNVSIDIADQFDIIPGLRMGYSIGNYTLNEFTGNKHKTYGFSLTPQVLFSHPLSQKFFLVSGVYLNTVFTELSGDDNLIVPAVYQGKESKIIVHPSIKLGVAYNFSLEI
jgi:hypothetical protein